ncbi:MAG: hypothetical protein ACLVCH_03195 [Roseburia inulinivorans]
MDGKPVLKRGRQQNFEIPTGRLTTGYTAQMMLIGSLQNNVMQLQWEQEGRSCY